MAESNEDLTVLPGPLEPGDKLFSRIPVIIRPGAINQIFVIEFIIKLVRAGNPIGAIYTPHAPEDLKIAEQRGIRGLVARTIWIRET